MPMSESTDLALAETENDTVGSLTALTGGTTDQALFSIDAGYCGDN